MPENSTDISQMDVSQMKITNFRACRYNSSRFTCEITVSLGEKTYQLTLPVYEATAAVVAKKAREWRKHPVNQERVLAAIKAGLHHVPSNTAK
jgi:hypothetical protein